MVSIMYYYTFDKTELPNVGRMLLLPLDIDFPPFGSKT